MIRLAEPVFRSIQGEGNRTGVLSIWVRLFGCSLRCPGFFRSDPTDRFNKVLQENLIDPTKFTSMKDIPVIPYGCDSLYAIDPRFKHLAYDYIDANQVYEQIKPFLYNGKWAHDLTKNEIDLCFTGGEPLLHQTAMINIMQSCGIPLLDESYDDAVHTYPKVVQIETNGTQKLTQEFIDYYLNSDVIINWNISPKLFNVTGEENVIFPDIISTYVHISPEGCLKFVINDNPRAWDELDGIVVKLKNAGCTFPVYVMPVGASREQQTDTDTLTRIANRAIERGYHVSGRLHCVLFGNGIGT